MKTMGDKNQNKFIIRTGVLSIKIPKGHKYKDRNKIQNSKYKNHNKKMSNNHNNKMVKKTKMKVTTMKTMMRE